MNVYNADLWQWLISFWWFLPLKIYE